MNCVEIENSFINSRHILKFKKNLRLTYNSDFTFIKPIPKSSNKLVIFIDDSSQSAFQKIISKHITLIQQIEVTQMQKLRALILMV